MEDSIQILGEKLLHSITENDQSDKFLSWIHDPEFDSESIESLAEAAPFVRSLVSLYKAGISIREKFFLKKLENLLINLPDSSEEEREKMQRRLESNQAERKRIGEFLIVLLERFNDVGKSEILASILSAYLFGNINLDTFMRMANAVDNCMVTDLCRLKDFEESRKHHPMATSTMYSSGLLELKAILDMKFDGALDHFGISAFGRHFLEITKL
ncbi:MAG: hypothetical protein WEA36_06395 [Balneolaceae bacterium]